MSDAQVLVVDLDGSLIRSDMMYETFWSAIASDWRTAFAAFHGLVAGQAGLKRNMVRASPLDVATLPYNHDVIAYVERWRAKGGRTVLVTAADQSLAEDIADHLGLFDEVYGSTDDTTLKGAAKATFLADRFGAGKFAYLGDSEADLPVWEAAGKAVVVDPKPGLMRRIVARGREVEPLTATARSLRPYFEALRPHQWLKNLLVFLPLLLSHDLSPNVVWISVVTFVTFCLIASGGYVLNDLLDLAADRAHPRKRHRALASGAMPIAHGTVLAPALLAAGLAIATSIGGRFLLVMVVYFLITTAYSLYFKRLLVIDICLLAVLYTARIVAAGEATEIHLSVWLLAFSIFFFFSLAAVKRQAELVDAVAGGNISAHGRGYQAIDIPIISAMAIASGYLSVLVMAMYVTSPVRQLYETPRLLWGICLIVLYWISRMVMKTHRGMMHDDPLVFAATDRVSLACMAVAIVIAAAAKYT